MQNFPTRSDLLRQQVVRAMQSGRNDDAARLLEELTQLTASDTTAWVMLASVRGQLGQFGGARDACEQAIRLAPDNPQAHSLMGNALASMGKSEEAIEHFKKAQAKDPANPGILNNLGNALFLAGDNEEAARFLEIAVRIKPDFAEAHNNLGNVYKALDKNAEAVFQFKRALQINPDQVETLLNLGQLYIDRVGFPDLSAECFRGALKLQPENREAETKLAHSLCYLGEYDQATGVLKGVMERYPEDTYCKAAIADIYEHQGKFDDAYRLTNEALAQEPDAPQALDTISRLCRRFDSCDEAISKIKTALEGNALTQTARITLYFSLGRLFDKLGQYDDAFENYHTGNQLTEVPYDPDTREKNFDQLIEAYSASALAGLPRGPADETRPVFILGMPRSGTSLTEQILCSHSDIHGAGELNDFNDMSAGIRAVTGSKLTYPACVRDLTRQTVDLLAKRYSNRLTGFSADALRITDKMPHNFMNIGLIHLLHPGARIIHCKRDPRDNCLSNYFQNFGWLHPYSHRLEYLGHYYNLYLKLMRHWLSVTDLPVYTVRYEDMVADQARVTRELVDFVGLEWDENCLNFHKSERAVATASYAQVRKPMYTKSVARWQKYEKHIGPLIEALGDAIDD